MPRPHRHPGSGPPPARITTKARAVTLGLVLAGISLAGAPPSGAAEERAPIDRPTSENIVIDVLVMRPIGIAATAIGTGVFIASLPFSLLGGNVAEVGHKLVVEPARYTFTRPLGRHLHDQYLRR